MRKRLAAYSSLLLASIIWGVAGPVIKYTLGFLNPFQFLFLRFLIISAITLPIFLVYLKKHPLRASWIPKLAVLGILGTTINLALVFLGFDRTTALQGTLLTALAPVFVLVGGAVFLREKITRSEWAGVTLAVAGTVFTVLGPAVSQPTAQAQQVSIGNFLLVLANVAWMAFVLFSKRWEGEGLRPFHITGISFFMGAVTFLPLAAIEAGGMPQLTGIPPQALLGVLYMSIFSSLVAYTAFESGLAKIEAGEADIFDYLLPVWAAPFAVYWLGEVITREFVIGASLIAVGVFVAEYKPGMLKGLRGHHLAQNQ